MSGARFRRRLTVVAVATAVITGAGSVTGSAAFAAPAQAPPPPGVGSALTPDRAPVVHRPGPARVIPDIGGAPSAAPWEPGVDTQNPGVITGGSLDPNAGAAPGAPAAEAGVTPAAGAGTAGIGLRDFSPVELRQISDRLQLLVNLANGNVVVRYTHTTVAAQGFGTDVSQVYNNLSTGAGAFGRGWSMTTGKDVGLEINGSTVTLHGPTGYVITYTQGANGAWTGGGGANSKLTRAADGTWTVKWDKSEDRWIFTANGVLREMRNNNDVTLRFNYDAANDDRLVAAYDSLGRVTTFDDYLANGKVQSFTDSVGGEHGPFRYSGEDLVGFADQNDTAIGFRYAGGNLVGITGPNGDDYTIGYDGNRRVTSVAEPTGGEPAVTRYAYPASGQTTGTDPRGNTSTYFFDNQARQTRAVDPNGNEQSKTWTANSDVASTTDALGANVTTTFDANNNPVSATLPTGARSVTGYNDAAHPFFPTTTSDAQGNQLQGVYNATGDLVSARSVQQNRDVFRYEYNPAGQITKATDGEGRVTTYQYDNGGRRTVEIPPAPRNRTVVAYDGRDRAVETLDGNGNKISYGYDAMDRVVEIGRIVGTTYTPLQYNNYDGDGNLIGRYFADTGVQFVYNPRNQVTEARNTRGATRYDVYYRYDTNNNLTDLFTPGGQTFYAYDKANRLIFQRGPGTGMDASFEYDRSDRRTRTIYPSGFAVTATYDRSGRQTALAATTTGGVKQIDRTYRWTGGNGQDTTLLQSETREGVSFSYRYDQLNQLVARDSTSGNLGYTLDRAANLTAFEGRNASINSAGQIGAMGGTGYTHDGAGNLTTIAGGELANTYSPTNQVLTSATRNNGTIATVYDTVDQSQRATITKTVGTTVTQQVLENTAVGITGITTDGSRASYVRDSAGGLIGQITGTGENLFAVTDYQGSTLALIDGSQNVAAKYGYTPYGTSSPSGRAAAGNPFRWIGAQQLNDVHGTYLTGYRQHDPYTARFTQPDPSGQEPNPYTYGLADPCSFTDPSGLASAKYKACANSALSNLVIVAGGSLAAGGAAAVLTAPTGPGAGVAFGATVGLGLTIGSASVAVATLVCLYGPS